MTNQQLHVHLKTAAKLTLLNFLLLGIRNILVHNHFFSFLKSNLLIGSMPVLVLALLLFYFNNQLNNFLFWLIVGVWVLFYPNAPYMISDLIHDSQDPLDKLHPEMIKFDTLLIFSLAMLSVYYGFLSLKIIFGLLKKRYGIKVARMVINLTLVLSCLGFYMGRELLSAIKLGNGYLYSWEVFLEPIQILKITWKALWPIHKHVPAYLMMALFGVIQYALLLMFSSIKNVEK